MKRKNKEPWTEAENELLQLYYHTLSSNALLAILPGRSLVEMAYQVAYLKRKNRKFKGELPSREPKYL